MSWMRGRSGTQRVARLLDEWEVSSPGPDTRVAQIIAALDPDLPVVPFRDVDLAADSLVGLADEVLAGPEDGATAKAMNDAFDQEILSIYGPIDATLPLIDDRWRAVTQRAGQLIESYSGRSHFALTPAVRTRLRAQALRITVDRGVAEHLARDAAVIRRDAQRSNDAVPWFRELAELPPGPEGGLEVALVMLHPLAQEQEVAAVQAAAAARDREREAERERRRSELAPRMGRARRAVGWATFVLAIHALALYVAHQNVDPLLEQAEELRFEGNESGAEWIGRLIDVSAWFWLPAVLAAAGAAAVLWARTRRNMGSSQEVTLTLRATQLVAAAQATVTPLLWPFGVRWTFAGRAIQHSSNTTRTDRRWGVFGAWLLGSYGIALTVLEDQSWGHYLLDAWSDELLQRYFESWPESLRFGRLMSDYGWTADFAVVFAVAGMVMAWISYTSIGQAERWLLRTIAVLGLLAVAVAPVTTLPVAGALLGLFILASIVVGMVGGG